MNSVNVGLAVLTAFSALVASFTSGVAAALWGMRDSAKMVPVLVERVQRIEDETQRELLQLRESIERLTATIERRQVGHTHLTRE